MPQKASHFIRLPKSSTIGYKHPILWFPTTWQKLRLFAWTTHRFWANLKPVLITLLTNKKHGDYTPKYSIDPTRYGGNGVFWMCRHLCSHHIGNWRVWYLPKQCSGRPRWACSGRFFRSSNSCSDGICLPRLIVAKSDYKDKDINGYRRLSNLHRLWNICLPI